MKKLIGLILCVLLLVSLAVPALAAEPVIIEQPQSGTWKEGAVAYFSVGVSGDNLRYHWYLEYNGTIYALENANGSQPWEAHAGTGGYGPNQEGNGYFFEGIGIGLDGCAIWVEIDDGHFLVESEKAYITVVSVDAPSVSVAKEHYVVQDSILDLTVTATDPTGTGLEYLWYETSTGRLENIIAIDRGAETKKTYRVDTTQVGVRYYVCCVSNSAGSVYSDVIRVEVVPEEQETNTIPVLFTPTSKFREGHSATVDIEAMTNYDARIWNAFLERDVVYVWYENGTAIPELINKDTAYFGTAGAVWQVMVKCDDLEILSEKMTIAPAATVPDLTIKTKTLPEATVGEEYYTRIESSDLDAEFWEYYNPGKANDLSKTGLTLETNGVLMGTPTQAGSYTFTVAAGNANSETSATFTLVVKEAPATEPPTEAPTDAPTEVPTDAPTDAPTEVPTEPATQAPPTTADPGNTPGNPSVPTIGAIDQPAPMPWWGILLIALGAAAVGVVVAVLVLKKKK